ncbi:MAG: hypothetical protein J1F71_03055 [Clostridiales bacterium]|nr:hypothetical protein [Clostridiales bacterium]
MEILSVSGASASDAAIIAVVAVFSVLCFIGLIVLLCRFVDFSGKVKNTALILASVFVIGFALRLAFALTIRGHRGDYTMFTSMIAGLRHNATSSYKGDASNSLYPMVYLIYLMFGGMANAMDLSTFDLGMQFMIKLPLIIADLLTAFAVYKTADRYINRATALTLCGFVCVCPIFFIGSAIWCSPITFTVMFISFACYFLARKNYAATISFGMLAAFSGKEGIYIFPAVCVFSVFHLVRAAQSVKNDKPKGMAVLGKDYRAVITVPVSFVLSFVVVYLLGLVMVHAHSYNPFVYIYEFLLAPMSEWKYFTLNGLSVYSIFNRSGAMAGARFPSWLFVILFALIIAGVTGVVYFTKRNRATMVLLIAFALFTMQVYYPDTTAISMQGVLAVTVVAYALNRDKRILYVLFMLGLCFAVNSLSTLAGMGQLNNLKDYALEDVTSSGVKAVTIIFSVITILTHLYFTVVTVNIGMTGQRRMLDSSRTIGGSLSEFFAVKKDK